MKAEIKEVTQVVKKDVVITMSYEEARLLKKLIGSIQPKSICSVSKMKSVEEFLELGYPLFDALYEVN